MTKITNEMPTSRCTPSTNDYWAFHVTIKKNKDKHMKYGSHFTHSLARANKTDFYELIEMPTIRCTPSNHDYWAFHVTNKKQ